MVVRLSTVFLAKRLTDLVTIRSIFPASASAIISLKPSLWRVFKPLMPSSVYGEIVNLCRTDRQIRNLGAGDLTILYFGSHNGGVLYVGGADGRTSNLGIGDGGIFNFGGIDLAVFDVRGKDSGIVDLRGLDGYAGISEDARMECQAGAEKERTSSTLH